MMMMQNEKCVRRPCSWRTETNHASKITELNCAFDFITRVKRTQFDRDRNQGDYTRHYVTSWKTRCSSVPNIKGAAFHKEITRKMRCLQCRTSNEPENVLSEHFYPPIIFIICCQQTRLFLFIEKCCSSTMSAEKNVRVRAVAYVFRMN
jgi:hypothetical protein